MLTATFHTDLDRRWRAPRARSLAPVHVGAAAASLLLAGGGHWPKGVEPLALLGALGLAACTTLDFTDSRRGFARVLPTFLALLGLGVAATVSGPVLALAAVVAVLGTVNRCAAARPALAALAGAAGVASTWLAGHLLNLDGGSAVPSVSTYVLMFLSGAFVFCFAWLGLRSQRPAGPRVYPVTAVLVGWWALALVPVIPVSGAGLVSRATALAIVGLGGLGVLALLSFDSFGRRAATAVVRAGVQGGLVLSAAAAALPWTMEAVVLALVQAGAAALLPLAYRERELPGESEARRGESLAAGLAWLEELRIDEAAAPEEGDDEELLRTRTELELARCELEQLRAGALRAADERGGPGLEGDSAEQYERRIRKLVAALERTEAELARVAKMKSVDPGQSSIYREVQGLDAADPLHEQKAELMRAIFDANVALLAKA